MSNCQSGCSTCNISCDEEEVEEVKTHRREDCKAFLFDESKLLYAPYKYQRMLRDKMDEGTPLFVDMSTRQNPYDSVEFVKKNPQTDEYELDTSIDKTTYFKDYYSVPFVVEVLFPEFHELTRDKPFISEDVLQYLREIPLEHAEMLITC